MLTRKAEKAAEQTIVVGAEYGPAPRWPQRHRLLQLEGQEASHHTCDEDIGSQGDLKHKTGLEELKGKG